MTDSAEALTAALAAGDPAAVTAVLAPLGEGQRAELWPLVDDAVWKERQLPHGERRTDDALAVALAWTVTGPKLFGDQWWMVPGSGRTVATADALAARRPHWLRDLRLTSGTSGRQSYWRLHRQLYQRGLVPRGDLAAFLPGFARALLGWAAKGRLGSEMEADASIREDLFLCFGSEEAGAVLGQWDTGKARDAERERATSLSWALRDLADAAVLDREGLLTATLDALTRDSTWPKLAWYGLLADRLDPSLDEIERHQSRYLRLLSSARTPVVSRGHAAVRRLVEAGRLDVDGFLAADGPLFLAEKQPAVEHLKLLQRLLPAEGAALALVGALSHPRPDVQKLALETVRPHVPALAPQTLETLREAAASCAPSLATLARSVVGGEEASVEATPAGPAPTRRRTQAPVVLDDTGFTEAVLRLLGREPVEPLLLDLALDGMLRRSGRDRADNARRHSPAMKMAKRADRSNIVGQRAIAALVRELTGAGHPREDPAVWLERGSVNHGALENRTRECFDRIRSGSESLLFSLPTDAAGRLDPGELAQRCGGSPDRAPTGAAVDFALARRRAGLDCSTAALLGWQSPVASWLRLFPHDPEVALSTAYSKLATELQYELGDAGWVAAVAEWLVELDVPAGRAGTATLALGLCVKGTAAQVVCLDAVLTLTAEARLDLGALASAAAAQVDAGTTKLTRLAVSLDGLRMADPAIAREVSLAVAAALVGHRDIARVLTVAADAVASAGPVEIPAPVRALAARPGASKAVTEARRLLEVAGSSAAAI